MDLASLTYTSQATRVLEQGEIERILYGSQVNNSLDGITGFLMYNGRSFLQVLEGTPSALQDVMTRIKADPRHHELVITEQRPLAARIFPDWTMGYLHLSGEVGNAAAIDRALRRDAPSPVREMLTAMAQTLVERR